MAEAGSPVSMDTFRNYRPPGPAEIAELIRAEKQVVADDQRLAHTLGVAVLATLVVVAMPLRGEMGWPFGIFEWAGVLVVGAGLLVFLARAINDAHADQCARLRIQNRFSPLLPFEQDAIERIRRSEQGEEAVNLLLGKVSMLRVYEYELLCATFGKTCGVSRKK